MKTRKQLLGKAMLGTLTVYLALAIVGAVLWAGFHSMGLWFLLVLGGLLGTAILTASIYDDMVTDAKKKGQLSE